MSCCAASTAKSNEGIGAAHQQWLALELPLSARGLHGLYMVLGLSPAVGAVEAELALLCSGHHDIHAHPLEKQKAACSGSAGHVRRSANHANTISAAQMMRQAALQFSSISEQCRLLQVIMRMQWTTITRDSFRRIALQRTQQCYRA